jgi:hypothetical protein
MRKGYTLAEQSRAAFILRRDIRKAHVDVRFNSRVAADCWRIIDAIENGEIYIEPPYSATPPITTTSTTVNGKRKSLDSRSNPIRAASQRKGKKKKT